MSSVVTIDSDDNVQHVQTMTMKIQDELYMANNVAEKIVEEITKIRALTRANDGALVMALTEAEESCKELQTMLPNSKPKT